MNSKLLVFGTSLAASFLFCSRASALILCAPSGGSPGTIMEGGQVVIRSSCLAGETALQMVTFISDTDLVETVTHDKSVTIGNDSTETIKGSSTSSTTKDSSVIVGKDLDSSVGGKSVADIAGDSSTTVGGNSSLDIAKDSTTEIGGSCTTTVAKSLTIDADDQITLKTGSASLVMKKNGDISLTGNKITIKAHGVVSIKGSKVTTK